VVCEAGVELLYRVSDRYSEKGLTLTRQLLSSLVLETRKACLEYVMCHIDEVIGGYKNEFFVSLQNC